MDGRGDKFREILALGMSLKHSAAVVAAFKQLLG